MRLIDADALKDKWEHDIGIFFARDIVTSIDNAPTIDAVPVVRGGECIHANTCGFCTKNELFIGDDWFCAGGERKEGEG